MKAFPLVAFIIALFILVAGIILFSQSQSEDSSPTLPSSHEYFWGGGCPNCANVDGFLAQWEGADELEITKLEIYNSRENANLFTQRADYCNIPLGGRGVPFLFTPEGKCILGDRLIIEYFESL